jgi:hypothetical protein
VGTLAKIVQKDWKSGLTSGGLPQLAMALLVMTFAACSRDAEPVGIAPPYADPGYVASGAWRMDYALTLTRDLPSAIAGSYGIEQRRNLALLMLTLAPTDTPAAPPPASPDVEATAVSLTGERTTLALERRDEANVATWLATVEVRHRVPVTIEIRARATGDSPELRARLTREFRLE